MSNKITGNNTHRHQQNPLEKKMHDLFQKEFMNDDRGSDESLRNMILGRASDSDDELSDREKSIILSTVQWMGSPSGEWFMEECGFTQKK